MLLDLNQIHTPHERYEMGYPAEAFAAEENYRVVMPVSLAFEIFRDKETFQLVGAVKTALELPCSRCLEPFALPVEAPFDLRYQPRAMNTGADEREIEEDDLSTAFYEHDKIDLRQLMREQFYLALPMKPLCRADCKGLCPTCGGNLNSSVCGCDKGWEDPRFAGLKNLKLKTQN